MGDPLVTAACRALALQRPSGLLLVAVSGGADSVALLDALWRGRGRRDLSGVTLAVGHFDHRLRADSARDGELVARLARERDLVFRSLAASGESAGGGLEERAREARYAALQQMATELGCTAIVTAHTATDQAETLLWRLARGSGARGLGAMRASRPLGDLRLIRPLLGVTREETRAYCVRHQLPFHDDPTNVDARPRARLRAEVLPVLERLAPGAVRRLAAAADRLRADDDVLERLAEPFDGDIHRLVTAPPALRRRALMGWAADRLGTRRRLTAAHIEALERLVLKGSGEVDLPSAADERRVAVVASGQLQVRVHPAPQRGLHRFGASGV